MSDTNALEILVSARDNASKSLAVISTNVGSIGRESEISANKINNLGLSLSRAANNEIPVKLQQISRSIVEIGQRAPVALLATGAGFLAISSAIQNNSTAIELFKKGIESLEDELIGTKRSLVDIKDALADTAKLFTGLDLNTKAKQNLIGAVDNIEKIFAKLKNVEGSETALGQKFITTGLAAGQNLGKAINESLFKQLTSVDTFLNNIEKRVEGLKNVQRFSGYLQQATLNPSNIQGGEELGKVKEEAVRLLGILGSVGQEIFFLTAGIQQLTAVFSGPYEAFIGQNVRLQETLLATQSQIVATNKLFKNGIEITNATEGIKALGETSKRTIDKIRTDSLKLVGVTSQALIQELLPVVTRNLSQLGGQLGDVPGLVTSLGASLGTLGLPLNQASQELTSIATGTTKIHVVIAI